MIGRNGWQGSSILAQGFPTQRCKSGAAVCSFPSFKQRFQKAAHGTIFLTLFPVNTTYSLLKKPNHQCSNSKLQKKTFYYSVKNSKGKFFKYIVRKPIALRCYPVLTGSLF